MIDEKLMNAVEDARILGIFKSFYESNNNSDSKKKLRNIIALAQNKEEAIKEIIKRDQKIELTNDESERILELTIAFLNKSSYRKNIETNLKKELLTKQNYKCAICESEISMDAHADHIIPFKYVGDCLRNNWQLLCKHCNEAKKDSLDYQIKFLLKLI